MLITYCFFILSGLIISGCMGPDLEYVPTSITINSPLVSEITTNSAIVSWRTDYDSWSRVQIMMPDSVSNTVLDTELTTNHKLDIEHLEPATPYLLLIISSNSVGGSSYETGKRLYFSTLPLPATTSP